MLLKVRRCGYGRTGPGHKDNCRSHGSGWGRSIERGYPKDGVRKARG